MTSGYMPTVSTGTISNGAIWVGRGLSGLVTLFLLFDGAIKLIPLEIVIVAATRHPDRSGTDAWRPYVDRDGALRHPAHLRARRDLAHGLYRRGDLCSRAGGSPLLSHTFFGIYLALMMWGGLYLRDERVRALIPLRRT
jgi:hypothetical protein